MNQLTILVIVAALFNSCSSTKTTGMNNSDNTLSNKEKKDGWQLMFDGSTTNGWHTYGYNDLAGKVWNVTDGTFYLDTSTKKEWPAKENRDLVSDKEYDNFHFKYDWKISKNGNSGLIFYVHEDKAKYKNTYETGLEMQVLDNNGHPDAKIKKHRAGDLYDLISSSSEAVKAVGEWNHAEIISTNGKLDFYLNGEHIINTTLWNDNWKQMVAGSKFKSMPGFGTFKKGHIALQEHGDEVWYKNIKIKEL